jgi:hypothetical protein
MRNVLLNSPHIVGRPPLHRGDVVNFSDIAPALSHVKYEMRYFDGFYDDSPYKRLPNAELDENWKSFNTEYGE